MTILSELHPLSHSLFSQHNVRVQIKRDDLIHPIISGNKWRKLKYNLSYVKQHKEFTGILSFGGSFSNHIHALAFACFLEKIPCVGIIRGEAQYADNFTLSWARHWGMKLHFVDRKTYRRRHENSYLIQLQKKFNGMYIVPEGGSNSLAIPGVSEVITELSQQTEFDTLLTPVGSGGTLAGLITGDCLSNDNQHKLLGVSVLKGGEYLVDEVQTLLPETASTHKNWHLLLDHHCGGYGKFTPNDIKRLLAFSQETGVDFEPVYSGKMVLALLDKLAQGYFSSGERIVLLHTGGMQGLGGMVERGLLTASDWPTPVRVDDT